MRDASNPRTPDQMAALHNARLDTGALVADRLAETALGPVELHLRNARSFTDAELEAGASFLTAVLRILTASMSAVSAVRSEREG